MHYVSVSHFQDISRGSSVGVLLEEKEENEETDYILGNQRI